MPRIFGFDIGTTSIGSAVIDYDPHLDRGTILRLGVRIFPEARDPDGMPLNQNRRQKRLMRRQLRRRRQRRRALNEALAEAGLLPAYGTAAWREVMKADPVALRSRGLCEPLAAFDLGRALYHLSKRRHFKGRDLTEDQDEAADERQAKTDRENTLKILKSTGQTLGQFLAERGPHQRQRGIQADRAAVLTEFARLWTAQAAYHPILRDEEFHARIKGAIFDQRPVFWRKNTLGQCRLMPDEALCPKGSWLSQQRRMLEKLNNLELVGGNARPLDAEERSAILEKLQFQESMSWSVVRAALKPVFKKRGEPDGEKRLTFNLEVGGERWLLGNALEAKLAKIFESEWRNHPHKQAIREAVHQRLWSADYGQIGEQRIVIRSETQRRKCRAEATNRFITDFGVTPEQAAALAELKLPTGWEPFSTAALKRILPKLEAGVRLGALLNGPEWENWREKSFPNRVRPTGEMLDRLPSPACKEEQRRIATLRNPTVVRTQNELRKVVNNLIGLYGKPDLIRIELTREVGKSKRQREEMQQSMKKQERRRREAEADLRANGIAQPSPRDIEKWLLWKECGEFDPYSGDPICFADLFGTAPQFDVEHIWPRWISFDNSFANKTLCLKSLNHKKANRTPFEAFGHDPEWERMKERVWKLVADKKMAPGKAKRFCREEALDDDFKSRQLNDTGFAAQQSVAFLKRLWPDAGVAAPVTVQPISGRITAQLRRLWGLNKILADDGEKTRADHRHHAIDALVVACTHPGMIQRLSNYWQAEDDPRAVAPRLDPPWPTIRTEAERAVAEIVVSHRVRKKVSGPLHKETTYGDTGSDFCTRNGTFRQFVTRKPVEALTKTELSAEPSEDGEGIADGEVRRILRDWVAGHGDDPKKAFQVYPRLGANGSEIRKVRILSKQQTKLMAKVATGYADLGNNHHISIFQMPTGEIVFDPPVSLYEAALRLSRGEPVVRRSRNDGAKFLMSLAVGESLEYPDSDKQGVWIVRGVWANGQIVIERATDAVQGTTIRPNPRTLVREGARKVAVDPIGRVRPAND